MTVVRAATLRWAVYLAIWFALIGLPSTGDTSDPAATLARLAPDLAVGAVAAALATWASLLLHPSRGRRGSMAARGRVLLHFLQQSLVGGIDVARRAFDPRMPLRPGFIRVPVRIDDDTDAAIFTTMTSLVPGTLPVDESRDPKAGRVVLYHCLDVDAPVRESLERDERLVAAACATDGGAS